MSNLGICLMHESKEQRGKKYDNIRKQKYVIHKDEEVTLEEYFGN